MKYGLLYYKETDNIGDDIQTYAAKRFLPSVDYVVDRENLNCFIPDKKELVSVIMNAWYLHNKAAWPPSPYINPLLISMHFTESFENDVGDAYLKGIGGDYLRKREPVGARDSETQKRLEKNNIQNYLSGCLTLTIQKFKDVEKGDYICAVDVPEEIIEKLEEKTGREIKVITHHCNQDEMKEKSFEQRMEEVEALLKLYQGAHLVITDRLHTMLPAMALETPVILLHKEDYEADRLGNYIKYVKSFSFKEFLENDILDDIETPSENNKDYLKIRKDLEKRVEEFINNSKKIDDSDLPSLEEYKEYVKNISYYKDLYEALRLKSIERYKAYKAELDEVWKSKIEGDNFLKKQLEEKDKELERVYNSKRWKFINKFNRK